MKLRSSAWDDQVLAALHACDGMATCREICETLAGPGRFTPYNDVYASLRRMETNKVVCRRWYENVHLVFWESLTTPIPVAALEEAFGA